MSAAHYSNVAHRSTRSVVIVLFPGTDYLEDLAQSVQSGSMSSAVL